MGMFNAGFVLIEQPKATAYLVFDENTLAVAMKGSDQPIKIQPPVHTATELFLGVVPRTPRFPESIDEVHALLDESGSAGDGIAFKADTVEELAKKIGLDPKALKETIDTYNASCKAGMDWDYYKPAEYLVPLNKPPYYAAKGTPGNDGAFGGVRVNPDMQAYKKGGGLVEGLYVVGDFATGKHIVMGGIKVHAINNSSWAYASGFIAASNMFNYLESLK